MSDKIWNKIQSAYEANEERVSEDLWNRLEAKLENENSDKLLVNETKPSLVWWKYAAVLLLLISVGAILFNQQNSSEKIKPIIVNNTVEKKGKISSEIINNEINEVQEVQFSKTNSEALLTTNEVENKNIEKLTKVSIQSKKEKSVLIKESPKLYVQTQIEIQEPISNPKIVQENTSVIAITTKNNALVEQKKYVKAADLLFERELNKVAIEQSSDTAKSKITKVEKNKIPKPKNLKVFGVTIFEDKEK